MRQNKISIYILSLSILTCVQSDAQSNSKPSRETHLLGFQVGSSIYEVSHIITKNLNHTLSSEKQQPSTPSEWCMIDLREERGNKQRKDIWENNGMIQPDLKIISHGHPQLPDADEVILEFMGNKLQHILVRIPCTLAADNSTPQNRKVNDINTQEVEKKRKAGEEYFKSLIATLEQEYGKLESDGSPNGNPWIRYKTIDQYDRRGDTYLSVTLCVSPGLKNNQATGDYDYLDIQIDQNLATAAKPIIINQ